MFAGLQQLAPAAGLSAQYGGEVLTRPPGDPTPEQSSGHAALSSRVPTAPTAQADPLAALLRSAPPLGAWVEDAACAALGEAADVFTASKPDPDDLEYAEAVCWRCPVRVECADYAAQVPVWGLWGASWHDGKRSPARAA